MTSLAELRSRLKGFTQGFSADNIQKLKADHEFALRKAVETERARYVNANERTSLLYISLRKC